MGSHQSWEKYELDLIDWVDSKGLGLARIGPCIRSRGLAQNPDSRLRASRISRDELKKEDGFVIFSALQDNLRRQDGGAMSGILLVKGDCDKLRWKALRMAAYKKPMGEDVIQIPEEESPWFDLPPNSYQGKMV